MATHLHSGYVSPILGPGRLCGEKKRANQAHEEAAEEIVRALSAVLLHKHLTKVVPYTWFAELPQYGNVMILFRQEYSQAFLRGSLHRQEKQ